MGNQVFANGMEISAKAMSGKSICQFPDVCFTPPQTPATPPGVPIPYPNTGMASDCSQGSTSVTIGGQEIMLKNKSAFKKSTGDEAGAAPKKGMINSKTSGKVYFIAWSMDVKVEGENVVRNLDMTTHNHASEIANGAAPMTHVAAVAMDAFANCKKEAAAVQKECGDNKHPPCPGALGFPVESQQKEFVRGELGRPTRSGGASADAKAAMAHHSSSLDKGLSSTKNAATMATKDASNPCVQAMKCFLRPYGADSDAKDGVNSCCPGQTGHHIPPWSTVESVVGSSLTHDKALCICLEGMNQSAGTHGKHHHAINFLLEQESKLPSSGVVEGKGGKAGTFKAPLSKHVKVSAAVTESQTGCSRECIEDQLNQQFKNHLEKPATHDAKSTGGTTHTQLDAVNKADALMALRRA
jgi:hypothetical protein